ncbi:hypothetical protein ACX03_25550 [Vibrio parahaemolyticus]|nr:hypothetical protein ACX03_25550 [Vibrio parahaemolyticus]
MKIVLWFLVWFGSSVSEAALFVESQVCNTVCLKELFCVVIPFSKAFEFQVVSVTSALKMHLI